MSTLNLVITTAGQAALAQAGTLGPVVISKVAIGSGTWTTAPTASATALHTQIKQLDPSGSSTPSAGIIHITATDGTSDAYNVYEMGLYTSTGILFAIAGGTTLFLTKATSSSALFSIDLAITNVPSGSLVIGDTGFSYPPATEDTKGVAEIATSAEANAGIDDTRLITPKKMADYFAAHGAGIATGLGLADTIKTKINATGYDTNLGDPRYTYSSTWYLTTGKTLISDSFNVPLGEVWEVEYTTPFWYDTDDGFAWAWIVDGSFADGYDASTTGNVQFTPTRYISIPNGYKQTFNSGAHTVTLKVGVFRGTGPDAIGIGYYNPANRIIRKYSGSAVSNQVLTGYALTSVDKSTQTIADWPRAGDSRVTTWTSTWYNTSENVISTDTITVPVGQVWDVEYDYPIELQSNDTYSTAWILNGTPDSNTLLQTTLSANIGNAGFVPNQYKTTLSAGMHTIVFKFCIFGGSGTDIARFQFNNKVIRKYSSAATSAGVVSKTTNGYCILPNGLIMQWGKELIPSAIEQTKTIAYPIPFPNGVLNISATIGFNTWPSDGITTLATQVVGQVVSAANSNMVLAYNNVSQSPTNSTCYIMWQAIGY